VLPARDILRRDVAVVAAAVVVAAAYLPMPVLGPPPVDGDGDDDGDADMSSCEQRLVEEQEQPWQETTREAPEPETKPEEEHQRRILRKESASNRHSVVRVLVVAFVVA